MKIYIYKSNGNIFKVEDNRFVQNGSGELAVNQIKFYFVDDSGDVISWPEIKWVKLACKRQDGLAIRPLNIGYDSAEKAWTYTITDTSGILGLQGSLEISALFVAADMVSTETGTVWKNERVLASVAVLGKVLRNVNYDGETWSDDIQRLEEGIDGLQGQIVETNAELDEAKENISTISANLIKAEADIGNLETRTDKLEQDVIDLKSDITGVYQFKGAVDTYEELLTKSATAEIGDVWEVIQPDGINYAWVGKSVAHPDGWDSLGQVFKLSPATYFSLGGVIPDGNTMEVDSNGVIKPRAATNAKAGIVKPDNETIFINENGELAGTTQANAIAYTNKLFDFYFKSVDYVFAGINPELELLENPVQVVIDSKGIGYVNLDYPLDLVEGKNYHIKATIGYKNGTIEEKELDVSAVLQEEMATVLLSILLDENSEGIIADKTKIIIRDDGEGLDFEADNNMSALYAGSGTTDLSYVTFTSIVQKEKQIANLLKEPLNTVVDAESLTPIGYKLGLEAGKAYDVEFSIDGATHTVTNFAMSMAELDEDFPTSTVILGAFVVPDTTKDEQEATKGQFYVYDGINAEMQEAENSVYVFVCQDSEDNAVTAQVLSIKENTSDFEEFVAPIELNFDNSNTIWTPGGDWCNGFNFKKSEFLKSIKDNDIVRLTVDMSITYNGEVFSFADVKLEEIATVDSEGLYLSFSLYNGTDDLFPNMYITDVNQRPSDYVFVGVDLGTTNLVCKIKSMEISHGLLKSDVTLTTDKNIQNLGYSLGLKETQYYDVDFYATDSSGGKVTYGSWVSATKSSDNDGMYLTITRDNINLVIIDGVLVNDSGTDVTVDTNNAAIGASQFGDFVSITITSILLSGK